VTEPRNPLVALVSRFAAKLRYPQLFLLTAALFLLDLVVPDAIPFADELLLGLGTLLLAGLRRRREPVAEAPR
jgi:MYXO-CTERM domain-containing protein